MRQRNSRGGKDIPKSTYLWVTLLVGAAMGVVNCFLYGAFRGVLPGPVLFALLVTLFALVLGVTIYVMARAGEGHGRSRRISDTFNEMNLDGNGMLFAGLAIALVVLFLASMLFEWLYEIEKREEAQASSYIFVLDESSSMENTDANLQRYAAVNNVVEADDKSLPYAVYLFAHDCIRIRDMGPRDGGTLHRPAQADEMIDGTEIMKALYVVCGDLSSGAVQGGKHPQVILLTDGGTETSLDKAEREFLAECRDSGISISAIGLGPANTRYLTQITSEAGGTTMKISSAGELTEGFYELSIMANRRNLLSARRNVSGDWLYMLLRLVMLTVIGAMIALLKLIALGDDMHMESLIVSCICALLAAMIVEFFSGGILGTWLCQWIFWMLLAPLFWTVPYTANGQKRIDSILLTHEQDVPETSPGSGKKPGRGTKPGKTGRGGRNFNEF